MANCKRWQVDGLVEYFVAGIKLHPAGLPVQIRHMVTHWEGGIFGGSIELRSDYLFKSSFRSCNRSYQWHGIAEDKDRKYRSTNILFSVKNIDCSLFVAADGSEQIFWLSTAQMNTLSKISQLIKLKQMLALKLCISNNISFYLNLAWATHVASKKYQYWCKISTNTLWPSIIAVIFLSIKWVLWENKNHPVLWFRGICKDKRMKSFLNIINPHHKRIMIDL